MPKFYITDGDNRFLIDTNTHLQACDKAYKDWTKKQRQIGKMICFSNHGFDISGHNCIETKIIEGLNFKHG